MSWTEVDSDTTSPVETDIPFGPITTTTSLQGRVVLGLDNMAPQDPFYAMIPHYVNEAKDEILTLGLAMSKQVLDHVPRLRKWRWWDTTSDGQESMPLPERMLDIEEMAYAKSTAAYNVATSTLYPATMMPQGAARGFSVLPRNSTGPGWPTLWRRAGSSIEFWPTASATPTDYRTTIVITGTRLDNILTNPNDTLLMSPRLQRLVVDLAVVITMEKAGWEEATDKRTTLESKLARLISPAAKENAQGAVIRTRIAGTPR